MVLRSMVFVVSDVLASFSWVPLVALARYLQATSSASREAAALTLPDGRQPVLIGIFRRMVCWYRAAREGWR